jgi:hypothetical protein
VEELEACGLTERTILERGAGWLHRRTRGVYAVGHANLALEGRFMAAVKACGPGARLSHVAGARCTARSIGTTAASSHGDDPSTRVPRGVRAHDPVLRRAGPHAVQGHPGDVAALGPRSTARPSSTTGAATRRCARCEAAASSRSAELAEVSIRLGPRRGSRLARIIATGPAPTRSALEDAVLDLMLRGGLAHPEVNESLVLDGRRVVPDFRWPAQRLVVEADGAAWHDNSSPARTTPTARPSWRSTATGSCASPGTR